MRGHKKKIKKNHQHYTPCCRLAWLSEPLIASIAQTTYTYQESFKGTVTDVAVKQFKR